MTYVLYRLQTFELLNQDFVIYYDTEEQAKEAKAKLVNKNKFYEQLIDIIPSEIYEKYIKKVRHISL